MGHRPRIALQITTRLFRDALSRVLDPYVEVVIVPESPSEKKLWLEQQGGIDLVIVSGVDGSSQVDAPVVVEVPPADGAPVGHITKGKTGTVRTLEELLALMPADADDARTA